MLCIFNDLFKWIASDINVFIKGWTLKEIRYNSTETSYIFSKKGNILGNLNDINQ